MALQSSANSRIQHELDGNARASYSQIAKATRLSKDSVRYRINQMIESGTINCFHTLINTTKLGIETFRLYIKLQKKSIETEQKVIEVLKSIDEVCWIISTEGDFDIGCWICVKNNHHMQKIWNTISMKCNSLIAKKEMDIMVKTINFRRTNLLTKPKEIEERVLHDSSTPAVSLDKQDIIILQLLSGNARMPTIEIASKVKLTAKTVAAKIKRLEREGVIVGYRVRYDLDAFNSFYHQIRFYLENISSKKKSEMFAYFKARQKIDYTTECFGDADLEIELTVKNNEEFRIILNDILEKFSAQIKHYKSIEFYKEHKQHIDWRHYKLA